jgi:hypothetical protein
MEDEYEVKNEFGTVLHWYTNGVPYSLYEVRQSIQFSINIYIYIYNVNAFFYWGTTVPVLVPRKQCFVKTPGTSSTNTTRANFNKYNIYIYIISNVRTILEYIHINHTVKLAHAAVRTRYEWFTITLCCKLYVSYSTPS